MMTSVCTVSLVGVLAGLLRSPVVMSMSSSGDVLGVGDGDGEGEGPAEDTGARGLEGTAAAAVGLTEAPFDAAAATNCGTAGADCGAGGADCGTAGTGCSAAGRGAGV